MGRLLQNFVIYSPSISQPSNPVSLSQVNRRLRDLLMLLPLGPVTLAIEKSLGDISRDMYEKVINSAHGAFWRDYMHFFVERLLIKVYWSYIYGAYGRSYAKW